MQAIKIIFYLTITSVLSQTTHFYDEKSFGNQNSEHFYQQNPSSNNYWYRWWYNDNNGPKNGNQQYQQLSHPPSDGGRSNSYEWHSSNNGENYPQEKRQLFNIPGKFQGSPGLKNGDNRNFFVNLLKPSDNNGDQPQINPQQLQQFNKFIQPLGSIDYRQLIKNGQNSIFQTFDNSNNNGASKNLHQVYNNQWQNSHNTNYKDDNQHNNQNYQESNNNLHGNEVHNPIKRGSSNEDNSHQFDNTKDTEATQGPFFWIGAPPPVSNVNRTRWNRTLHTMYPIWLRPGIRRNSSNSMPAVDPSVPDLTQRQPDLGQIDLLLEANGICGQVSDVEEDTETTIRIALGHTATDTYPWLVAIYLIAPGKGPQFICGASLITSKHAVSAAHCFVTKLSSAHYEFVVSNNRILNPTDAERTLRKAEAIMLHPNYNPMVMSANADVAVAIFDRPVEFGALIKPICMWKGITNIREIRDEIGRVVGWGANEYLQIADELPMEINMGILDYSTCITKDQSFLNVVGENSFCTGYRNGSGPCMGDSGSGFMLKQGGRWSLRGVVSLTTQLVGCDINHYIGITDVAKYQGWIYNILRGR